MVQMIAALPRQVLHRKTARNNFAGSRAHRRQEGLIGIRAVVENGERLAVDGYGMLIGGVAHLRGQAGACRQENDR